MTNDIAFMFVWQKFTRTLLLSVYESPSLNSIIQQKTKLRASKDPEVTESILIRSILNAFSLLFLMGIMAWMGIVSDLDEKNSELRELKVELRNLDSAFWNLKQESIVLKSELRELEWESTALKSQVRILKWESMEMK